LGPNLTNAIISHPGSAVLTGLFRACDLEKILRPWSSS